MNAGGGFPNPRAPVPEPADEAALVEQARLDPQAAERLIRGQLERVYAVCLGIVRNPEVAAELSQEAVLRLYRTLPEFRGDCSFGTWAWRVARNLALNWRARLRERGGDDGQQLADPQALAPDALAAQQRAAGVRRALDTLTPEEREALLLHYEGGLSMEEVTEVMGLRNRTGARGLLQRARRKLRRSAQAQLPEDSVVLRAGLNGAGRAREAMEATLTRLREDNQGPGAVGEEPRVRPMRPRQRLMDLLGG